MSRGSRSRMVAEKVWETYFSTSGHNSHPLVVKSSMLELLRDWLWEERTRQLPGLPLSRKHKELSALPRATANEFWL